MRVVMPLACYYPWIGGAEVFVQRLVEHLVGKGDDVEVVTGLWANKEKIVEEEVLNGVRVSRVKPMVDVRYLRTLSVVWPMYRKVVEIMEQRTDGGRRKTGGLQLRSAKISRGTIIHSHIFPGMVVGVMLKRKTGLPLITTVQGGDLVDYPETTGMMGGVLRPLISWSLKQADMVHAVSGYLAKRAQELGARKTVVVPNGVDTSEFRPRSKSRMRKKLGFSDDGLVIISHSRLTPKNGLDLLIKAVGRIMNYELRITGKYKKQEIINLKLVMIGEGEQRGELERLVRELGLEEMVKLLGEIPHKEIPEYLAMADIFCRPARDEGFGISFIEAMACGLPVVGTKVGGIPEVVAPHQSVQGFTPRRMVQGSLGKVRTGAGFLVEKENVDQIAGALARLIGDKRLRERMGREGRKAVEERFGWEKIMLCMEEVYEEVCRHFRMEDEQH